MDETKEMRYAGKLVKLASKLADHMVIHITTYDEAIDSLVAAFKKKGNSTIENEENFVKYINRFLPENQKNDNAIISAIYKSAANEYLQTKN